MNPFPSNKTMLITILLVTLGFGIKFISSSNQQFFQLNFDWDKEKPIKDLGMAILDSISYNYVKISKNNFRPDPQNTYKISTKTDSYYFRYIYALLDHETIQFKGVEWITDIPESTGIEYNIEEVFLPLKDGAGPKVVTLGDRLLVENEAKYYRKDLTNLFPVTFKGEYYDVFDFPHEAIKTNTSKSILAQIKNISKADYYVLMYGSNEKIDSLETFQNNTKEILEALQIKKPQKIILITLPPSKDSLVNQRNREINNVFQALSKTNDFELIDTYQLFIENLDKYLRKDGVNISRDGYHELAMKTSQRIK
ncbi:MAG TPA: SGNH/GDSL hydrolase family protein [Aequorivita sp.]|nr:SGNH/GDSL hydrolase family protein [Aequorivita sp.]|tara:strand:- start:77328 stop:78257 length:930 start_codon:yes stop_codon:yes gene_type:complete